MTIQSAYCVTERVPLTHPYTIAYETISDVVNHFLVITLADGTLGIGCAAPAPEVTGESEEASLTALQEFCRNAPGTSLRDLPEVDTAHPSAQTALDLALYDLLSKLEHTHIAGFFDSAASIVRPVVTSVTIGIMGVEETVSRAKALISEGIEFLKIKGGHDISLDIERLQELRISLTPGTLLALDANQGYSVSDVELLERSAPRVDLQYLEQPTPKSELNLLAAAARATSIPVMADESVQSEKDVRAIGKLGAAQLINIKLQKMGGLASSHRIDEIAKDFGIQSMLGCMDESALSIAAALHFGASHPNVIFYDLDGHLDLASDPFEGLVLLKDGMLTTGDGDGLGLGWAHVPKAIQQL